MNKGLEKKLKTEQVEYRERVLYNRLGNVGDQYNQQ